MHACMLAAGGPWAAWCMLPAVAGRRFVLGWLFRRCSSRGVWESLMRELCQQFIVSVLHAMLRHFSRRLLPGSCDMNSVGRAVLLEACVCLLSQKVHVHALAQPLRQTSLAAVAAGVVCCPY